MSSNNHGVTFVVLEDLKDGLIGTARIREGVMVMMDKRSLHAFGLWSTGGPPYPPHIHTNPQTTG